MLRPEKGDPKVCQRSPGELPRAPGLQGAPIKNKKKDKGSKVGSPSREAKGDFKITAPLRALPGGKGLIRPLKGLIRPFKSPYKGYLP